MKWRVEYLWLVLFLLPIILGVWWIPGRKGGLSDTFSVEASGKKAIFYIAQELFPRVTRSTEVLPPTDPDITTLCLLGPVRYPHSGEWEKLSNWVKDGNTLIFAARHDSPNIELEHFNVSIESILSLNSNGGNGDTEDENNTDGSDLDRKIAWRSRGAIEVQRRYRQTDVLVTTSRGDQVIRKGHGAGTLIVVASDFVFSNSNLVNSKDRDLAVAILKAGVEEDGILAFEESVNIRGGPKAFGILFDPVIRPVTLQLILCAILFIWAKNRRMGQTLPPIDGRRREISEHARALGNLHFKAKTGGKMLQSYLEFFQAELRTRFYGSSIRQTIKRSIEDGPTCEEALEAYDHAVQLSGRSTISNQDAAASIRDLANIKELIDDEGN